MDTETKTLIPTLWKSNIPKGLSFPVGAQLVSEHLAGVPHFSELTITFWGAYEPSRIHNTEELAVITASFRKDEKSISNSSRDPDNTWLKPDWSLLVSPVPSQLRSRVRGAMVENGFRFIREWLSADRPANWYFGRRHLHLYYIVDSDEIISKADG